MSATYLGTFPVRKIVSANIIGQGILVKTEKIIVSRNDASSYVPEINSPFIEDSNLWVTDAKLDYQDNGLAEITVVAHGKNTTSSTTLEIQPSSPFIYGLSNGNADTSIVPVASPSGGSTVKVSFVDTAGNEGSIISQYSLFAMPSSINGVDLPSYTSPGIYGNTNINIPGSNQIPSPDWRLTYKGYICKDIQMQRQGSAVAVSLFFKESGYLEIVTSVNENQLTVSKIWEY